MSLNQKEFFQNNEGNLVAERTLNTVFVGTFTVVLGLFFVGLGIFLFQMHKALEIKWVPEVDSRVPQMLPGFEQVKFRGWFSLEDNSNDLHYQPLRHYITAALQTNKMTLESRTREMDD